MNTLRSPPFLGGGLQQEDNLIFFITLNVAANVEVTNLR